MNPARAVELPLLGRLPKTVWFRSVRPAYRYDPPRFVPRVTRFNPGDLEMMYFAPESLLARFEARDVFRHWSGDEVARLGERHVVVEYAIDLGVPARVVDARPAQLAKVETTVQEMTGDWATYPWNGRRAPTQYLGRAIFDRGDAPLGMMAASARNPRENNLILFAGRLPPQSITFVQIHEPPSPN